MTLPRRHWLSRKRRWDDSGSSNIKGYSREVWLEKLAVQIAKRDQKDQVGEGGSQTPGEYQRNVKKDRKGRVYRAAGEKEITH